MTVDWGYWDAVAGKRVIITAYSRSWNDCSHETEYPVDECVIECALCGTRRRAV